MKKIETKLTGGKGVEQDYGPEYGPDGLKRIQFKLRKMYTAKDQSVKEMDAKHRVMGWLFPEWIAVLGPDPPDLFATDGEWTVGVEVVTQSIRRNTFDVSEQELRFRDGEAVFVIEVEIEENRYEYLVLTPSEMAVRLEGKYRRGNRIFSSVPRSLKGWEEYRGQKGKLRWRPKKGGRATRTNGR